MVGEVMPDRPSSHKWDVGVVWAALTFALIHTFAFGWWAASISSAQEEVRKWQVRQDERLAKLEIQQSDNSLEFREVATLMQIIKKQVDENNELIRKMISASPPR